ncbi:histidine kinase [Luteimicrobium sp. NPDC057192]|uniref:histidine kinase n=1 Tax=Luteimicrobium sp. NPDC057192 TaxID=3346042 RepID=UPI003635CB01
MELHGYVDELQRQLVSAAEAAGDEARAVAERLVLPLDAATRLVLLEALSEAAGEISAELAPGGVDVRLRGRDPEFVVNAPAASTFAERDTTPTPQPVVAMPAASAVTVPDDAPTTRTTLRLPDQLKTQVEAAAVRDGVSLNTWLVRAVATALEPIHAPQPGTTPAVADGRRVTGWAR